MQQGMIAVVGRALLSAALLLLAACGDDDINIGPTPSPSQTATRTASATRTPTATPVVQAQVAGQVVVGRDVSAGEQDGLKPLPPGEQPTDATGFDRGLGHADWHIDDGAVHGTTDEDGRFSVSGLAPGRHTLHVTRTIDGNLMTFAVPIVVGDDGAAEVLVEVSWGLVRGTSTYTAEGVAGRAVFAPNGTYMIVRDDQIVELFDGWRTLVDGDRDGAFDPQACGGEIYACDDSGACRSPEDICVCIPSCPDCADCTRSACVPRTYFHTPECGPDGLCKRFPYQCNAGETCALGEDQCTCVSSCFGCDNCESLACVSPCPAGVPLNIVQVRAQVVDRLVVGREAQAIAQATFSDGSTADVTWLVDWGSSAPAVAGIDAWGRVAAQTPGETDVTASLNAGSAGTPARVTVVERPTLQRIVVYNTGCYWLDDRLGLPPRAGDAAFLPPPNCQQTIRIGGSIYFRALGEFDTGFQEDITDEVTWSAEPAGVLSRDANGAWTGAAAGVARVRASLGAVSSDDQTVTVVERATILSLSVYPHGGPIGVFDGGPVRPGADAPCFECGYSFTMLSGDTVQFGATAHYDTGEWEDVTARVTWRSDDAAVAAVAAGGLVTAGAAGAAEISATLEEASSAPTAVRVVAEATLQGLSAYLEGADRAIGAGDQAVFHAAAYYDVGFGRDVTAEVTWRSSDENVGGFDTPGVFTGRAAGDVQVWAELDGVESTRLPLEVFATSELAYCDPDAVNRGVWADDFNRVTLESDCARYTQPDVVELRFSVTEQQRPGGIFDPCLDLEAWRGDTLVRTIREEGCGDVFLPPGALGRDEAAVRYQLKAFWDLKDDDGQPVAPGEYEIRGTFYLYYDPVVTIDITVEAPTGE